MNQQPDDVDGRQGDEKGHLDDHELIGLVDDDRLGGVHKEQRHGLAEENHHHQGEQGVHAADNHPGPQPGENAVAPAGADVLPAIGGHGHAQGVKDAGEQLVQLVGGGDGGHHHRAQAVDGSLQQNAANGRDGALQAHGDAHAQQAAGVILAEHKVIPGDVEQGEFFPDEHQARQAGDALGNHRGPGGPRHPHGDDHNQEQVQGDVQQGGDHQENHRRAAVPQGPQQACQHVVQHNGGDAQENHHDVAVGVVEDVRGGVHPLQNGPAQGHGENRDHQGEPAGQPQDVAHKALEVLKVLGAVALGHRDGEPGADAGAEAQNQEVDRAGGAHRRQGPCAQEAPHDDGVHHGVELLEQVAEHQGDCEA